jgi:VIT1/CCC1 family predicted Fe2+/Mn2+ transporter
MKNAFRTGISFGLTSGGITTLGLMVGLHSGTHSKLVVLGGILTIAIADAFSDALGIHMAEESENVHTDKHIWTATISTFLSKLLFALTFAIPVLLFELTMAIFISVAWGLGVLALLSYNIAKSQGTKPWGVVAEHLLIALAVVAATHFVGEWIAIACG